MRLRNEHCNGTITKCRVVRLIFPVLILLGLFIPHAAGEPSTVNVLVLPFEVRAQKEVAYLRTQIASVLAEHLQQEGATLISLNDTDTSEVMAQPIGANDIGQLASKYAADQVIWGSFTLIGDSFSLDARMTASSGEKTTASFSTKGKGMENLPNVLKKLTDNISFKLFKHEVISEVRVHGNQRIETDAILRVVKAKPGSVYQRGLLSADLRAIYSMGWFDDVRVEATSKDSAKSITFHVKEKPVIRYIRLKGNFLFDEEKIKEDLTITTGTILNSKKISANIEQIELLYKEKNYHDIKVDYNLSPLKNNQADIEFTIEEGEKIYITEIRFEGNRDMTNKRLKKVISANEKGFFSWITSSGDFDRTELNQDSALLRQFYHNQGYIEARVGEPEIDFQKEGIVVTFKIDEWLQFKVGKIDIVGDLFTDFDKDAVIKSMNISKATYFSRENIREDVLRLKEIYGGKGYAYSDVRPLTSQDPDKLVVDVTFKIAKGAKVYFNNITISGNTRTRDKVIRRQFKIYEQELFNGAALKRSIRNLHRIGYFEDIKVNTTKGSDGEKIDVDIEVTEQPTGMFSFGAGYSDEEKMFLMGDIAERNLFGRGQTLQLKGTIGGSTSQYQLSFTEPWLFDIPLSGTVSLYDNTKEYENEYDRHTLGGGIRLGYRLFDYTRGYVGYAYDVSDITIALVPGPDSDGDGIADDNDGDGEPDQVRATVPDNILELEGENITSSVTVGLTYDSRNHRLNPSDGSRHSASFEYAGIGGDVGFDKFRIESSWYWPVFKSLVFMAHGKYGTVNKNSDNKLLPDYEKFYLGGINSIRGFSYRGISVVERNSLGEDVEAGGEQMVQFNFELIFPISKNVGLMGVVFYDTGNVYESSVDLGDMRQSFGGGFRWFSPMAPIRVEYGQIIDPREGEKDGRWEFTMGGAF